MKVMEVYEVAELLKVHENTIRRMVKEEKIPFFRIGQSIRFDLDQLRSWISTQQQISKLESLTGQPVTRKRGRPPKQKILCEDSSDM